MTVVPGGIETLGQLAGALRQLRRREARQRGQPELTYRELATKTGWSLGIIGAYFTGKVLPPTDRFDVLIMLLGASPAERGALATARDRIAERRQGRAEPVAAPASPPAPAPALNQMPVEVFGFVGRERQLGGAARTFRMLGLHPGPDIAAPLAASLPGVPVTDAHRHLAELVHANLITEPAPGRYALHDLLRAYAIELTREHDSETDRHQAARRMLNSYIRTAQTATSLLNPVREVGPPSPARLGAALEELDGGEAAAQSWYGVEYPLLLGAVPLAVESGLDEEACHLAWILGFFCYLRGHWTDWATVEEIALPAAERLPDRVWRARIHRELGYAYACLDRHEESQTHFQDALDLFGALGDDIGMARTHRGICLVFERQSRYPEALEHARHSRDLLLHTDDKPGKAYAFNSVGWYHALSGDFQEALENCRQAVALLRDVGDRLGEASTWDSLGYAHHHLGQFREAIACYDRALDTFRELGDRYYEADTLNHIGDTYRAIGDGVAARGAWRRALAIFDELKRSEVAEVRAKLGARADGQAAGH